MCMFSYRNVYVFRLLNEAEGSLLDDEHLLITLQTSKTTSQDIKEQLETAEETELQIDSAREVVMLAFYEQIYLTCNTLSNIHRFLLLKFV